MSVATGPSGILANPVPLTLRGLQRAMARFRLPKYSELLAIVHECDVYVLARALWRELFPDQIAPEGSAFDVELYLLDNIAATFFPLDEDMVNGYFQAGEHPLHGWMDPETYGILWEMPDYYDGGYERALLHVICEGLDIHSWLGVAAAQVLDDAAMWMTDRGYAIQSGDWLRNYGYIERTLSALKSPLDGLCCVYKCLRRNTGNSFFDIVGGPAGIEIDDDVGMWGWEAGTIRDLAYEYAEAEPELEKMFGYIGWYRRQPDGVDDIILGELAQVFDLEMLDGGMDDDDEC